MGLIPIFWSKKTPNNGINIMSITSQCGPFNSTKYPQRYDKINKAC
jgi:hypothetical protein